MRYRELMKIMKSKKPYVLDQIPNFLPMLQAITVHGKGKGGGEVVANIIKDLYSNNDIKIDTIIAGKIKNVLAITGRSNYSPMSIPILLTAGLRDLPLAIFLILRRINYSVYIQVPYHKSKTIKDLPHFILAILFENIVVRCSKFVISNSAQCLSDRFTPNAIVLPITQDVLKANAIEKLVKDTSPLQKSFIFVTACRFNKERGIGSRNINAWIKFLETCAQENLLSNKSYKVIHYGECDPDIKNVFVSAGLPITFAGYDTNWLHKNCDAYLFFSNYEGFGLAAFEASLTHSPVIVSPSFPDELVDLRKNIFRLHDENYHLKKIIELLSKKL
jgi:hypothetical protein